MQINIQDAVQQTTIFILLFIGLVFATLKKSKPSQLSHDQTNELKGLAILMVLFGHTGYFLSTDTRFLFPLSVDSGVGVNLFFILSGYGLTMSLLTKPSGVKSYLVKRFSNIYPALWIVLTVFFLLDFLILHRPYSSGYITRTFLGFFPSAELFTDIDSPLWYITSLVFYYLTFRLLVIRRYPWITALLLTALVYWLTRQNLPIRADVIKLYRIHFMAFPLGVLTAWVIRTGIFNRTRRVFVLPVRYLLLIAGVILAGYFSYYSNVGQGIYREQLTSLLTSLAIILVFVLKPLSSRFLILVGTLSYEIYLIHWPLMSRYNFIYGRLPAAAATFIYLAVLLVLGLALRFLAGMIQQPFSKFFVTGKRP